jgi:hypothetical protein
MKKLSELSITDLVALRESLNDDYIQNKENYSIDIRQDIVLKMKAVTFELKKRISEIDFNNHNRFNTK